MSKLLQLLKAVGRCPPGLDDPTTGNSTSAPGQPLLTGRGSPSRDIKMTLQRVTRSKEEDRIFQLPERVASEETVHPDLWPIQNQALIEMSKCGGLLGPIGVGHGKSLIALLAGTALNCQLSIIFCPASTRAQLESIYQDELERGRFALPPRVEILSYSALSQPDGTGLIGELVGDIPADQVVVVCDEAHKVKRFEAARTKRLIRWFQEHPQTHFVALSGTITAKSLHDYGHLAELALRDGSPLPREKYELASWANCIDTDGTPTMRDWKKLQRLILWASLPRPSGCVDHWPLAIRRELVRKAFQKRLATSEGVVLTKEGSIGTSLRLIRHGSVDVPLFVSDSIKTVYETGVLPNGDVAPDDVSKWRAIRQLSTGFFYFWQWPNGIEDTEWLLTRSDWNRHVRNELLYRDEKGYDSPLLVWNRIAREVESGDKQGIHRAWILWNAQRHKPTPPTFVEWFDSFALDYALDWANAQEEPVILWYESQAVGDALKERGLPVYAAGDDPMWAMAKKGAHTCAMSIRAHGIGKNLQKWSSQLVIETPTSGQAWEQLIGRTHRAGQDADEVHVHIMQHTRAMRNALSSAVERGEYIQETTGNKQKLCYGDWSDV